MTIHIYSIMRNEEALLPYFLRHYSTFADKIFIINDHSTDKTLDIARENPKVRILDFKYNRGLNEDDFNRCFAFYYKKLSRNKADWVMCVDGDEIIYNSDILANLKKQQKKGIKIIKATGFSMFSETFPRTKGQIYEECFMGIREKRYDKPVTFNPEVNIVFDKGRHKIKDSEGVTPQYGKLALLHYRYLSRKFFLKRTRHNLARIDMPDKLRSYLIKGGLDFFDRVIKTKICQKVI